MNPAKLLSVIYVFCSVWISNSQAFVENTENTKIDAFQQLLSPFELMMVVDLLLQISMYRCPFVNQKTVASLKTFIFMSVAKAPESGVSHPQFYYNYRNLVACLNNLDNTYEKVRRQRRDIGHHSADADKITDLDDDNQTDDESLNHISSYTSFFTYLTNIMRESCPKQLHPQAPFFSKSLKEILNWVEQYNLYSNSDKKFFGKFDILNQMYDCYEMVKKVK